MNPSITELYANTANSFTIALFLDSFHKLLGLQLHHFHPRRDLRTLAVLIPAQARTELHRRAAGQAAVAAHPGRGGAAARRALREEPGAAAAVARPRGGPRGPVPAGGDGAAGGRAAGALPALLAAPLPAPAGGGAAARPALGAGAGRRPGLGRRGLARLRHPHAAAGRAGGGRRAAGAVLHAAAVHPLPQPAPQRPLPGRARGAGRPATLSAGVVAPERPCPRGWRWSFLLSSLSPSLPLSLQPSRSSPPSLAGCRQVAGGVFLCCLFSAVLCVVWPSWEEPTV